MSSLIPEITKPTVVKSKNVVTYIDKVPHYDLAREEVIFPIEFGDDPKTLAYFHMDAQVRHADVEIFLDDLNLQYRSNDRNDEQEMDIGDEARCQKFIGAHVRGVTGVEGTPSLDQIKEWLDDNAYVKTRIYREGYDRVITDSPSIQPKLSLVKLFEIVCKTKRVLYDPSTEEVVTIQINHTLKKETEADRIKHKKAHAFVEKGKRRIIRGDWPALRALYGQLALSIDGMLIDGEKCTQANKSLWVEKVPLSDQIKAVNFVFSRTAIKNG